MLKEKIKQDLKTALLGRKQLLVETLRMLLASLANKEKEKRYKISKESSLLLEKELQEKSVLTDEETQEAVMSEIKKRKESIEAFEKGGRKEMAEKERQEMAMLRSYVPEQLSQEEIQKVVQEAIATIGASGIQDMGKAMGAAMDQMKGRADGALVSKIVKEFLTR